MSASSPFAPAPFTINIAAEQIEDLHRRLDQTRWPEQGAGGEWSSGVPADWLREVVRYWRCDFDWQKQQDELNQLPQYSWQCDSGSLHFVHCPSPHTGALPLVLTHGWPGSFVEFQHLVGPLTEPEKYGGDAADAFHVICPSLPGYTFSSPPADKGWNTARIAEQQAALMAQLGYDRYGVQGGDWGAAVSSAMAHIDAQHCIGLHLNMVIAPPPTEGDPMEGLTEQELQNLQRFQHWMGDGNGYFRIQATRPDTLGFGLTDSPAGLAAWILEKFRDWSDCDGEISNTMELDQVLTNISLYWFTGSITSAARLYYEESQDERDLSPIAVPTAGALFPGDIICPPRRWAEKIYNIQQWTQHGRGGHFAAMEVPELLLEDVRRFYRALR